MTPEERQVRFKVGEELIHWLNEQDTSEMTMHEFRSALHMRFLDLGMTPSAPFRSHPLPSAPGAEGSFPTPSAPVSSSPPMGEESGSGRVGDPKGAGAFHLEGALPLPEGTNDC